ncbi:MAG: hypothetical protein TUN42_04275 [Dehalogenimonas sp.]
MALSSIVGSTVFKQVWGKFRVYAYEALSQGALIGPNSTNDGWMEADQSDSLAARAVAMEAIAAGAWGWACLGAEVAPYVDESTDVCAAATDVGSAVYLGEEGDISLSAGVTFAQEVGIVNGTTSILLIPAVSLSGTDLSLSGNETVGGTLGVTGNTTLGGTLAVTGASTLTGGATIGTGKDLTFAKGGVVNAVVTSSDDSTATAGCTHLVDTSVKDVNLTLPAAAAGLNVRATCSSATKQLTVTAGSGDKLINASGAQKDSAKANAAAYAHISLVAVDATNWITVGYQGTWTYS